MYNICILNIVVIKKDYIWVLRFFKLLMFVEIIKLKLIIFYELVF